MRPRIGDVLAPNANNLGVLRLIAAIAVLISHCALLKIGSEAAEPLASVMAFSLSDHALHAFFFISGLTIAASLARARSYREFIVARVLRIWPALIVVTLILTLCVGPLLGRETASAYFADPGWAEYIRKAVYLSAAGLNLPGVFSGNPHLPIANGSPWTLKYEVICYGLIAICAISAGGRHRLARTHLIAISTAAAAAAMLLTPAGLYESFPGHLARFWFAFGLGVLTWQYADRLRLSFWTVAGLGACLWVSRGGQFERPLSIVFTASLVLFLAILPAERTRRFTNRTDLSYGVYVTAWPITQTIIEFFPDQPLLNVTLATLLLSIAMAFASWTLIEKPAMSLRPLLSRCLERFSRVAAIARFPRRPQVAPVRANPTFQTSSATTPQS